MLVFHGFFGSSDNWQTLGKGFSQDHKVYLVDLRNHGLSPHSDIFNYDIMVRDIEELFETENLDNAILLGHSMGGKLAMNFASLHPTKVSGLVVVDIGPKQYPPHHENIFNAYRSVQLEGLTTRKEVDTQLAKFIDSMGLRQFILKNLSRTDKGFSWKINLDALEANAHEVGKALNPSDRYHGPTLFIAGEKSDYIEQGDRSMIEAHFPEAQIRFIKDSGHWVHAEKPRELFDMVQNFIKEQSLQST